MEDFLRLWVLRTSHGKVRADLVETLQLPAQISGIRFADRAAEVAVKTWQVPNLESPFLIQ